MDLFQAMKVFAKVAESGSLSGAARALDMSNPSVTRHVADLESYLHARLFNRSTRRLSLTDTGAAWLVQLLPEYQANDLAIYAVYPGRQHLSAKVRTFVDFLVEQFGDDPYWDRGW